jgi:hypothetical protein
MRTVHIQANDFPRHGLAGRKATSLPLSGDAIMLHAVRWPLVLGAVLLVGPTAVRAADDDEMVANPMYKFWAGFKPGSTVTSLEKTILSGPDKNTVPDGIDEKTVTYKLLSVKPDAVVVQTEVSERNFLGTTDSAPTKKTFPPKIKRAHLRAAMHDVDAKPGEDTLELLGKKLECKTLSGTEKKEGEEIDHKVWISDQVPGGIVKHTRVTKQDGKLIADTTIVVKSYKVAD